MDREFKFFDLFSIGRLDVQIRPYIEFDYVDIIYFKLLFVGPLAFSWMVKKSRDYGQRV